MGDDGLVRLTEELLPLEEGLRPRTGRQRAREETLDGIHSRLDAFRAVDDDDRDAAGPRLVVDRLGKDAVEVSRPAGHDALVQPCELELLRGDQPDGAGTIPHRARRQRRSVRDDERRARQCLELVDDHGAALAVERELEQLLGRPRPRPFPGRHRLPADRGGAAGLDCAVAVRPRVRVGAVPAQTVATRDAGGDRGLPGRGRTADPEDVL